MNREEAKELFRNDKNSYGGVKSPMSKVDQIYDEFESQLLKMSKAVVKNAVSYIDDLVGEGCHYCKASDMSNCMDGINDIKLVHKEDCIVLKAEQYLKQFETI